MDEDLKHFSHEQLLSEVVRLRNGIRAQRDVPDHDLSRHPDLSSLLPEQAGPAIEDAELPPFVRGNTRYRMSLDAQDPPAP